MKENPGYAGSLLQIDLTNKEISRLPLPGAYSKQLLSGKLLAQQLFEDCTTGEETAFSEGNPVIIASSLLTGTGAPGSARFDLAALSAKDDLPAFSNCGGNFGLYLKQAGYDAIILKGKCAHPVWLEISGEKVVFHDAAKLWGLGTGACRERLREELGETPFGSLCIGPAGEHLVNFASVLADGHSTGRAGFGAVLGWKQLKAITVTGNRKIQLYDALAVSEINKRWYSHLREISSGNTSDNICTACPLHCTRHRRDENPILEELGMDAIAAEAAARGATDPEVYRAIAFGEREPEEAPVQKGKAGKRRKANREQLAELFGMEENAEDFSENLTQAVCALGQCMFTVNGLVPGMKELHLLTMINSITGKQLGWKDLPDIGQKSRSLEQKLKERFHKKITSAE